MAMTNEAQQPLTRIREAQGDRLLKFRWTSTGAQRGREFQRGGQLLLPLRSATAVHVSQSSNDRSEMC